MKRILSVILSAVMALSLALPALAARSTGPKYPTPEGYNDNDYQKLVAFLETEDENGVKNGIKLNPGYDPAEPETWNNPNSMDAMFYWEGSPEKRIKFLRWENKNLTGDLDVSGCAVLEILYCYNGTITSINVEGCIELYDFRCFGNLLTELDVSTCSGLNYFFCSGNALTELDVSSNPSLWEFSCDGNPLMELDVSHNSAITLLTCGLCGLTELDVTHNRALEQLICLGNSLRELDLSENTYLYRLVCYDNLLSELDLSNNNLDFEMISSLGSGTIGNDEEFEPPYGSVGYAVAAPRNGAEFLGWYTEDGELISTEPSLSSRQTSSLRVVAHFSEASFISGDADGNGLVELQDALLALRFAMELTDGLPCPEAADMDGDGSVTLSDALVILRTAMGLL